MGKLAQVLKKRFCHMVEAFISCKNDKGNESGEEPKIRSSETVSIEETAIRIKAPRGPTRPSVPKGPPAQTS
ncbi:hypothetical protein QUC31_003547 [Theobroma cacao]|nr:hypothetical protein QQP08_003475 [Theobroma cacao]